MSNTTYNQIWLREYQRLNNQLDYESPKDSTIAPKDRESAFQHLSVLYIRYIQIFRKLEDSYDQILHPQKRRLLKNVVMSCLGRLLEIKHKIIDLELSDVHTFNDILLDMKLIPDDLRIPTPRYIVEEASKEINDREKILIELGARDLTFGDNEEVFPPISLEDAVKIIQINERGRQGKLRAKFMADIRLQAKREREMDIASDEKEVFEAAKNIQRVYKGHLARKTTKEMTDEELIFLGMELPKLPTIEIAEKQVQLNRQRRKNLQQQYEEDYKQALVSIKEKIMKVEGPDMKESIQDSFRQWYMEHKRIFGKFPDFPEDEVWKDSGFRFVPPIEGQPLPSDSKDKDADLEKPDEKDKKKSDKKGKGEETDAEADKFKFDDSPFLKIIELENSNFSNQWLAKDETENFSQKHDQEIIKKDKRVEVEGEIKNEVFEILKDELKNLKLAVEKEKGGKGKKGAKGGKKGKKGGKKDGKKGKKEKDITANRTMESIVEELIKAGILQKYPIVPMSDFKGNFDMMNFSGQKTPVVVPSLAEVQRLVTEFCILPFGLSGDSLEKIPFCGSTMLFGPRGTGKTMLVNAIATMLGAQILNLSPKNTADQFVGKSNVTKMVHMAFKVAKAQAPAIIYIDNIEMVFAKKVPKDDLTDPKRIKKDLLKNLKNLSAQDRVIFIGTSYKPWDGDIKSILPMFQKFIFCPKPNYASRLVLWQEMIAKKVAHNLTTAIDLSVLTRMSEGLSAGSIKLVCDRILSERRLKLLQMGSRDLSTTDFINQLANLPPENPEEDALFLDFFSKTPMLKKREAMLSAPADDNDKDKGKKDKKKK